MHKANEKSIFISSFIRGSDGFYNLEYIDTALGERY